MKTENLNKQFEEIDLKAKKEKEQLTLKHELAKKSGIDIDNIIVYSTGSVCFGWRTPLQTEEVIKLSKLFPVNGENFEMKFASSEKNYPTDSPLVVRWDNDDLHHQKVFKIKYTSDNLEITIEVPESHFKSHIYTQTRQGKHKGFGRYETFRDVSIDYFYTQKYSGGYNVLYFLEGAEKVNEYENFVFTGEFKYSDEIVK